MQNKAEIRKLPAREAVIIKYAMKPDSDMEYPIRLLEKNAEQAAVFLGKVGLSISKLNMINGEFDQYDHIFLLLDPEEKYNGDTITVKDGLHAVIRFNGTHKEAADYYRMLMDFIGNEGFEVSGDSLEITLIDYGFTSDMTQFVTEIQIPVK